MEALLKPLTPALTLIVVTHNLAQARRVSDHTMFFYQGQLVEHGPTDDLFAARSIPRPSATSPAAWAARASVDSSNSGHPTQRDAHRSSTSNTANHKQGEDQ